MIGLLQRVDGASVAVEGNEIARIAKGLLVLVGVERGDDEATLSRSSRSWPTRSKACGPGSAGHRRQERQSACSDIWQSGPKSAFPARNRAGSAPICGCRSSTTAR